MRYALTLLLLLLTSLAQATTRYATPSGSGSSCTQASPCSMATCIAATVAGDVCYLRGGTYTTALSNLSLTINSGTSYANPVTIAGYPGETAIIRPTSGGDAFGLVSSSSAHYIIFDNLVIDGINTYNAVSIQGVNTHHIRLQNSEVINGKGLGPPCDLGGPEVCPGGQGISAGFNATFLEFLNLNVHDNGLNRLDHGFYIAAPNSLIEGCDIHHNSGEGLQVYEGGCTTCANGMVIRNNKIHHNQGDSGVTLNSGSNIQFYNNVVYNNVNSGLAPIGSTPASNVQVFNNTFYGNNGYAIEVFAGAANTQVRNNIVFGNTLQITNSSGTTSYATNLCGSSGTGCTHTGNPQFVDPASANFQLLATSAALNNGTTISTVPTDLAGVARPQGTAYDMGAYERVEGGGPPPSGSPIYVSAGGHGDTPHDTNNDCVEAENIATPKATLAGAMACMTVPGKILYVRGGTYTESIDTLTQPLASGTSAANMTTIQGYASETAVLRPGGINLPILFFRANEAFIAVKKLTLDCNSVSGSNGLATYPGTHDLRIEDVDIKNCQFEGAYLLGAQNITFVGNGTSCAVHGTQVSDGIGLDGTTQNVTIDGCTLFGNNQSGLRANTTSGSNSSLVVRNSRICNNGTGGSVPGIALGAGTGALVSNSLIYRNPQGLVISAGASGAKIYNNTIANNTGIGFQCQSGASSVAVTNTISYGNGTDLPVNSCGATLTTNQTTNPSFTDSASDDFTLLPISTAINAGTTLPEVPTDILGVPRPYGSLYDVGAYESTTAPPAPDIISGELALYMNLFYF